MSEEHDVDCPMEDEKQTDENEEKVLENGETVVENEVRVVENEEIAVANDETVIEKDKIVVENEEIAIANDETIIVNGEVLNDNDEPVVENAEDCPMTVDTEEPSANTSKEDSAIDAIDKETLSSEVDEKKDLYGANERATLSWTAEGNEFKISWSLPEGAATANDYIALCCTGKIHI